MIKKTVEVTTTSIKLFPNILIYSIKLIALNFILFYFSWKWLQALLPLLLADAPLASTLQHRCNPLLQKAVLSKASPEQSSALPAQVHCTRFPSGP